MAFISGPRQCGKTTLAKMLLKKVKKGGYYNWDDPDVRRLWVKSPKTLVLSPFSPEKPLFVFDEIHKVKGWKKTLKGVYDTLENPADIIVTGSARLNIYKKGGDSLMGRYLNFRLHPFSLRELLDKENPSPQFLLSSLFLEGSPNSFKKADLLLDNLLAYGGFPEPYLEHSEKIYDLWKRGRIEKIVREDLRDLSRLPELSQIEMLISLLPERAANVLSLQSLREILEVAYDTVKRWMKYLEELYYYFELKPWHQKISRSLKKEGKLYLWDWSEVNDKAARFENLVASHLLKTCHYWTDTGEGLFELFYLRNKEKKEIDFLITKNKIPWLPVECKLSETNLSPNFMTFLPQIQTSYFLQIVATPGIYRKVSCGKAQGLILSAGNALSYFC